MLIRGTLQPNIRERLRESPVAAKGIANIPWGLGVLGFWFRDLDGQVFFQAFRVRVCLYTKAAEASYGASCGRFVHELLNRV